jgi:hypothetical protein
VELVGAVDGTGTFQQVQRGALRLLGGLDHGLVLGTVLVGLEQDLVELLLDGGGALAGGQLLRPLLDLQRDLLLALDGHQGLLEDVFRRLLEAALAATVEVVRGLEQAHQHGGLLHGVGAVAEVLAGQLVKAEVFLGGHFPDQVHVDVGACAAAWAISFGGRRLGELEQHVGGFHLHALARIELDLHRTVGFGHHTTGQELAGVIKKGIHGSGTRGWCLVNHALSHFNAVSDLLYRARLTQMGKGGVSRSYQTWPDESEFRQMDGVEPCHRLAPSMCSVGAHGSISPSISKTGKSKCVYRN